MPVALVSPHGPGRHDFPCVELTVECSYCVQSPRALHTSDYAATHRRALPTSRPSTRSQLAKVRKVKMHESFGLEVVEMDGRLCRTRVDAGDLECAHYPSMAEANPDIFIQISRVVPASLCVDYLPELSSTERAFKLFPNSCMSSLQGPSPYRHCGSTVTWNFSHRLTLSLCSLKHFTLVSALGESSLHRHSQQWVKILRRRCRQPTPPLGAVLLATSAWATPSIQSWRRSCSGNVTVMCSLLFHCFTC